MRGPGQPHDGAEPSAELTPWSAAGSRAVPGIFKTPPKGSLCCPSSPVRISAAHAWEMLQAGHGTGWPCNGLEKLEGEDQDMVPSCRLSAWAGGSAVCCWAHSGSWWHQSSVGTFCQSVWGPSAGVLVPELGSKSAEQGQGSSSLQGALPGTHRNCWWCQPFAVAASHPEAGLEPGSRKAPKCMAPGELTPGDASCVESHSWVLVLPSPLPELSSLFQPDVPAPQVATATVKPRPAPHVHLQNPKVFQAFCLPA